MNLSAPLRSGVALAALAAVSIVAAPAEAKKSKPDAALVCASTKHKEAAKYCGAVLKAWAKFDKSGDPAKRDTAIAKAKGKLDTGWDKAEQKASGAGVDCAAEFLASSTAGAFVDSATGAIVVAVNDGLDFTVRDHRKCGSSMLKAAAAKCQGLLDAEATYQKNRTKPTAADKREKTTTKVRSKFTTAFDKAKAKACPTTATTDGVEGQVDGIVERVVRDTLMSASAGDGAYVTIPGTPTDYEGRTFTPVCIDGSPYKFFARRGTVNKLVMYYQGGGACWEQSTCSIGTCDQSVEDGDNPANDDTGFADMNNPDNPFRDWNVVFVSYCSCDIHFGDAARDYDNATPGTPYHAEHRGYQNSKVAEKWAREHFLAPENVFVTGSSAGAYGAWFNAPLLHRVWPTAKFDVLADAGNGVVTQNFLDEFFPNWNFEANLPTDIPGLADVLHDGSGIPGYTKLITAQFPDTNWAHYTTAFDGSPGGQTGFYNLMLNDNDILGALTWWEGSCAFRDQMKLQALDTAAAVGTQDANYRFYIGSGSRHTMYGSNKVYTDTTGGVPTIVDWVDAMIASTPDAPSPAWTNVEANPQNILLPGDPRPNPLVAPFAQQGPDVVINCP